MVLFVCLPPSECKLPKNPELFSIPFLPSCWAQNRSLINICWMSKWSNEWKFAFWVYFLLFYLKFFWNFLSSQETIHYSYLTNSKILAYCFKFFFYHLKRRKKKKKYRRWRDGSLGECVKMDSLCLSRREWLICITYINSNYKSQAALQQFGRVYYFFLL